MITVVETINAVSGKADELKKALLQLVPISRRSPGCLQYDLLKAVENEHQFLVLMRWEKLDYLRQHESSNYIAQFVKNYDQVLYDEVKVTEWNEIPC